MALKCLMKEQAGERIEGMDRRDRVGGYQTDRTWHQIVGEMEFR